MSTDLEFFEENVPIVPALYGVFVAIGWGLLIGNCAFQCAKAMFAGFGFETESPVFLLLRTFLFGFLLIFSSDICEICLSIGNNVIDLLGIPKSITLKMPTVDMFTGFGSSWLLVVIIGFILGFQLIKLFFEIAERYVVVAVLTLLCPVGLAFGGSKSTKDICVGFIRTYASMIVMMVMNVLFLKLIISGFATMPSGIMVLPWCLLVVGIAKTARKADQIVSRIGLTPALTGDSLGVGRGLITMAMAARTLMAFSGKGGGKVSGVNKGTGSRGGTPAGRIGASVSNNAAVNLGGNAGSNISNSTGGTHINGSHVGGSNVTAGTTFAVATDTTSTSQRNAHANNMGGCRNAANNQASSNIRFGANAYNSGGVANTSSSTRSQFNSSDKAQVNTNRFGIQSVGGQKSGSNAVAGGVVTGQGKATNSAEAHQQNTAKGHSTQSVQQSCKHGATAANSGNATAKTGEKNTRGGASMVSSRKAPKGIAQPQISKNAAQIAANNAKKSRFGSGQAVGSVRQNANPISTGKGATLPIGMARTNPGTTKNSAHADVMEKTDTLQETVQSSTPISGQKDGEDNG